MKREEKLMTLEFFNSLKILFIFTQHLEQEKHELRRRFENREGEWEGRVSELERRWRVIETGLQDAACGRSAI